MHKEKGKITYIGETVKGVSKAGKEWSKVQFAIQTLDEKYPKTVAFSLLKTEQLEGHSIGGEVEVTFVVESNLHNEKYYANITAINLSKPSDLPF